MEKVHFSYDSTICLGCCACQVACQTTHGLGQGEFFRRVTIQRDRNGRAVPFSGACNHCEKPACVAACPTGAMYRDEESGLVLHDEGICIGCGCCVWNCPYGAVSISLTRGVSQKCDSCLDRREAGLAPACVAACSMEALRWEDPAAAGEGWKRLAADFLPDSSRTEPTTAVRFLREEDAL